MITAKTRRVVISRSERFLMTILDTSARWRCQTDLPTLVARRRVHRHLIWSRDVLRGSDLKLRTHSEMHTRISVVPRTRIIPYSSSGRRANIQGSRSTEQSNAKSLHTVAFARCIRYNECWAITAFRRCPSVFTIRPRLVWRALSTLIRGSGREGRRASWRTRHESSLIILGLSPDWLARKL
jgi:hypothetical protein